MDWSLFKLFISGRLIVEKNENSIEMIDTRIRELIIEFLRKYSSIYSKQTRPNIPNYAKEALSKKNRLNSKQHKCVDPKDRKQLKQQIQCIDKAMMASTDISNEQPWGYATRICYATLTRNTSKPILFESPAKILPCICRSFKLKDKNPIPFTCYPCFEGRFKSAKDIDF